MSGDKLASGARSATFSGATKEMPGTDVWKQESPNLGPELTKLYVDPNPPNLHDPVQFFEDKPRVGYEGQPVGDSVLVARVEREHSSNLVLPDSMKAKSEIGYIVAVGEKVKRFKAGQMVMWDKFASHGADIELLDTEGVERHYLLVKDFDILMGLKKIKTGE